MSTYLEQDRHAPILDFTSIASFITKIDSGYTPSEAEFDEINQWIDATAMVLAGLEIDSPHSQSEIDAITLWMAHLVFFLADLQRSLTQRADFLD